MEYSQNIEDPFRRYELALERHSRMYRHHFPAHIPTCNSEVARYPDFFVIGAQKAGSTWLHIQLLHHPMVWSPIVKELFYFDQYYFYPTENWPSEMRHSQYENSIKETDMRLWDPQYLEFADEFYGKIEPANDLWYCKNFSFAGVDQLCCDATASNAILPQQAIAHMLRLSPHAKCVFIVRNPISRSWSHLRMIARQHGDISHEEMLKLAEESADTLYACSNYARIYNNFCHVFGKDRILLCNYHDLSTRPGLLLNQVCDFLGLPFDYDLFPIIDHVAFRGPVRSINVRLREMLTRLLQPTIDSFKSLRPDIVRGWAADEIGVES